MLFSKKIKSPSKAILMLGLMIAGSVEASFLELSVTENGVTKTETSNITIAGQPLAASNSIQPQSNTVSGTSSGFKSLAVTQSRKVSTASATKDIQPGDWRVEYEHDLVLISGDIITPVEILEPTVLLEHKDGGIFSLTKSGISSATRNPIASFTHTAGKIYNKRPTLFISIPGFKGFEGGLDQLADGDGTDPWQINGDVQRYTNGNPVLDANGNEIPELNSINAIVNKKVSEYQYKHMIVDWNSTRPNRYQVRDMARVVKSYLRQRVYAWDVVIIGHSRGGIFAHELADKLDGFSKINKMHTFLLDPTASTTWVSDHYPRSMSHDYGSLFYNGTNFADEFGNLKLGTVSDRNISGYNNYSRNDYTFDSTHSSFGNKWTVHATRGFDRALKDLLLLKDSDSFVVDGNSDPEVVKVRTGTAIKFDGHIDISADHVEIVGMLSVGPTAISTNVYADGKGVEGSVGLIVSSSYAAITRDRLEIQQNQLFSNYGASISQAGVSAGVNVGPVKAALDLSVEGVQVNVPGGSLDISGGEVKVRVGPIKISCCKW